MPERAGRDQPPIRRAAEGALALEDETRPVMASRNPSSSPSSFAMRSRSSPTSPRKSLICAPSRASVPLKLVRITPASATPTATIAIISPLMLPLNPFCPFCHAP